LADIHEAGALRWASNLGVGEVGIEGNAGRTVPRRVGLLVEGRQVPIVPHIPLFSSASHEWEGLLVERHLAELNIDEIPKHRHSGIALSMQLNGSLRLQWKSGSGWQSATTDAGSILLHGSSGCNESIWNGTYDRIMCEVIPTHLAKLTEGRFAGAVVDVADRWSFKDARLEHLLRVLDVELQQGAPAGPLFGEQVGDAIAMLLATQYATVKVGLWGTGGSIPPPRLKQVLDYIEAHLDQQTHLSDLAQTASMSPFYFARLFKNSMGISPHKYVTMRRIERSKELLRRSDITIFEIGVRVGYLDPKHFRVVFHREVGVSPSEFRASQS
jgi:AraC family transcriptional regulator